MNIAIWGFFSFSVEHCVFNKRALNAPKRVSNSNMPHPKCPSVLPQSSFIYLDKQLSHKQAFHLCFMRKLERITCLRAAQWTIVSHSIPELQFPALQMCVRWSYLSRGEWRKTSPLLTALCTSMCSNSFDPPSVPAELCSDPLNRFSHPSAHVVFCTDHDTVSACKAPLAWSTGVCCCLASPGN